MDTHANDGNGLWDPPTDSTSARNQTGVSVSIWEPPKVVMFLLVSLKPTERGFSLRKLPPDCGVVVRV